MVDKKLLPEPKKSNKGCLVVFLCLAIGVALLPSIISRQREKSRLALEKHRAEWRQECFNRVKNGDKQGFIMDPLLLQMFANDPDCVENLEHLHFDMVEISPNDAKHIARLTCIKEISFYDSQGADYVLENLRKSQIESLSFEMAQLSDSSLRSLSMFSKLKKVRFEHVMYPDEIAIVESLRPGITVEIPYPAENEPGFSKKNAPKDK